VKRTDLAWLAGLWEGEGTFMTGPPSRHHKPVMLLRMTDRDVVEQAAKLMDRTVSEIRRAQKHYKRVYGISLRGKFAVIWMIKLRSRMGKRRRSQIDRALACYVERHDNGNATKPKLSRRQAARIRQRWATGNYTLRKLGKLYGVSQVAVFRIVHNESYKQK
jgi:hypothetical protein